MTSAYATLVSIILFFEFLPTLDWKPTPKGKSKILMQQSYHLRWAYRVGIFIMTAINGVKALVYCYFLFNKNLNNEWLKYFYSTPTGITLIERQKSIMQEGGVTLLAESALLIIFTSLARNYRSIVVSVKDSVFYRKRMVASSQSALLDELHLSSV